MLAMPAAFVVWTPFATVPPDAPAEKVTVAPGIALPPRSRIATLTAISASVCLFRPVPDTTVIDAGGPRTVVTPNMQ